MCLLSTLDPHLTGGERAAELGLPALEEALAPLREIAPFLRVKLLLCMDEFYAERRADGTRDGDMLSQRIARRAGGLCANLEVDTVLLGGAGVGIALERNLAALESGQADVLLVGGVHTDYEHRRVAALFEASRLFAPDNLNALIPGECAAFVALTSPNVARTHRLRALADVHAVATGLERARPDNEVSGFEARAMTTITREAGKELVANELRVGWMLTDLSFELLRLYEFQAMTTRTQKMWCEPQLCDAPAQRMGHLGAAAMALHIVLAAEAWRRGWAPHSHAMSFGGSDHGERAAVLLSSPG